MSARQVLIDAILKLPTDRVTAVEFVTALEDLVSDHTTPPAHVATKEDIAILRGEMREELAKIRGEINTGFANARTDMKSSLNKVGGIVVIFMTLATSVLGFLVTFKH